MTKKDRPLFLAGGFCGNPDKVGLLLDSDAKVDERSTSGITPLFAATSKPNAEVFRLLTEAGADANARGVNR